MSCQLSSGRKANDASANYLKYVNWAASWVGLVSSYSMREVRIGSTGTRKAAPARKLNYMLKCTCRHFCRRVDLQLEGGKRCKLHILDDAIPTSDCAYLHTIAVQLVIGFVLSTLVLRTGILTVRVVLYLVFIFDIYFSISKQLGSPNIVETWKLCGHIPRL